MKLDTTVQVKFDSDRVVCGRVSDFNDSVVVINGEKIRFIDLKEFRVIEQYVKTVSKRSSKIGIPGVRKTLVSA